MTQTNATFQSEQTAQKMAEKLTKKHGVQYAVLPDGNQFKVVPGAELIQPAAAPENATASESAETQDVPEFAPTDLVQTVVPATDVVTFDVPDAHQTAMYVITPVLGAKPRWFEKKRLISAVDIPGGVRITCQAQQLLSRGLKDLVLVAQKQTA